MIPDIPTNIAIMSALAKELILLPIIVATIALVTGNMPQE
jgi:hypothetical protein